MKKILIIISVLCSTLFSAQAWAQLNVYGFYKCNEYSFRESLFNPDNISVRGLDKRRHENYTLAHHVSGSINILSAYFYFDVLAKSTHEQNWEHDLLVTQCYLQHDITDNMMLMLGRGIQRWGTGYAFNPADFIAPAKELSDPDNEEKSLVGNEMIMLEYYGASYSAAVCFVTDAEFKNTIRFKNSRFAGRFYKHMYGVDLSIMMMFSEHETPKWGATGSYVCTDRLEIHGELSLQRGSYGEYHYALREKNAFYYSNPFSAFKQDDGKTYAQYVFGINYTLPGDILWIVDYYHKDQSHSNDEWARMMEYLNFCKANLDTPYREAAQGNIIYAMNMLSSRGAMRDYLMHYQEKTVFKKVEVKSTTFMNLNDLSLVLIPAVYYSPKNSFTFYARCFIFNGKSESEFGEMFTRITVEGGLRYLL